jgi:hypothetical protein
MQQPKRESFRAILRVDERKSDALDKVFHLLRWNFEGTEHDESIIASVPKLSTTKTSGNCLDTNEFVRNTV